MSGWAQIHRQVERQSSQRNGRIELDENEIEDDDGNSSWEDENGSDDDDDDDDEDDEGIDPGFEMDPFEDGEGLGDEGDEEAHYFDGLSSESDFDESDDGELSDVETRDLRYRGIFNSMEANSATCLSACLRSFAKIIQDACSSLSLTVGVDKKRLAITSNLVDHLYDTLVEADLMEIAKGVEMDSLWFGGRLPNHPMFMSGWKGNPFRIMKNGAFRVPRDSELYDLTEPFSSHLEISAAKSVDSLKDLYRELHAVWLTRQAALMSHLAGQDSATSPMIQDAVNFGCELMAKCAISQCYKVDWLPDWHTSSKFQQQQSDFNSNSGGASSFDESFMSNDVDPNDPIAPILLHSPPLHFIVTEKGHPYQWAHSASDAYHQQCARYLVLGPSEPVSFFPLSETQQPLPNSRVFPQGVISGTPMTIHLQRPMTVLGKYLLRGGENRVSDYRSASQRVDLGLFGSCDAPDVFPFTRYLARNEDDIVTPRAEALMSLPTQVVSMDMAYGFLAIGFDDGLLAGFCVEDGLPRVVLYVTAAYRFDMFNSVHLSRRAVRKTEDDMIDDEEMEYEYTLIVTRNSGFVDVHIMSKHTPEPIHESEDTTAHERPLPAMSPCHPLATSCFETLGGFHAPVNDARLSPDGKYLACVGDSGGAWIANVKYASEEDGNDMMGQDYSDDSSLPKRVFGSLQKIDMDSDPANVPLSQSSVLHEARRERTGAHARNASNLTMQYLSWSCDSRFFAATTDTYPWVFIFDALKGGAIVCRLDAATPTYAVSFHPSKPHLLAFSNRLGYVHVVDMSEYLMSSFMPPATQQNPNLKPMHPSHFVYPPRQILRHDYKVPVEPRSGSYPDLTALARDRSHPDDLTRNLRGVGTQGLPSGGGTRLNSTETAPPPLDNTNSFNTVSCKINGLLWSDDGERLYVSTNRRVLMHTVMDRTAPSLAECVSRETVWDRRGETAPLGANAEEKEILERFANELLREKRWAGHW
ncbi:hypothetical protein HDU80_007783 [Chytriomyces hyalinus]|nr:hypothetical protein HDU80_007783 [Chytriomyces hyalinus]